MPTDPICPCERPDCQILENPSYYVEAVATSMIKHRLIPQYHSDAFLDWMRSDDGRILAFVHEACELFTAACERREPASDVRAEEGASETGGTAQREEWLSRFTYPLLP